MAGFKDFSVNRSDFDCVSAAAVAGCESLLEDFDPLHATKQERPVLPPPHVAEEEEEEEEAGERDDNLCSLSVTHPTPDNSPKVPKSSNPFRISGDFSQSNPFDSPVLSSTQSLKKDDMRHCISDSNLLNLENEISHRSIDQLDPLVTRSEEDLSTTSDSQRHCVASELSESCTLQPTPSSSLDDLNEESDEDALDYKNRRTRSTESSPTMDERKQIRKKGLSFLSHSVSKPETNNVNMNSPELSGRKRGRDRSASKAPPSKAGWVSRFRPGVSVPIPGMSARESIMQAELRQRAKDFCTPIQVR